MAVKCDKNSTLRLRSFMHFIWQAEVAGEEETPLCPILLRGWVEKHEEVSAGCWLVSHSSFQKEKCPCCLSTKWSRDCAERHYHRAHCSLFQCSDLWSMQTLRTGPWLQSHWTIADVCAVWLNKKSVYTARSFLLTVPEILVNELSKFIEKPL